MEILKNGQWWNLCRNFACACILGFVCLIVSAQSFATFTFSPKWRYEATDQYVELTDASIIAHTVSRVPSSYFNCRIGAQSWGNPTANKTAWCDFKDSAGEIFSTPAGTYYGSCKFPGSFDPTAKHDNKAGTCTSTKEPTCPTGQVFDSASGNCSRPCSAGTDQYTGTWAMSSTGGQACVNGCFYKTNQTVCGGPSGSSQSCVGTVVTNTGSKCSTTENNNLPSSCSGVASAYCCLQQGKSYGMVNGTAVCTPASSSNPVTKTSTKTETKTNPDGTKSVTESTTSTTDKGDSGVTSSTGSKTTGYNASGAATGTTDNGTTTTEESKQDFCKGNPNDETCKEKSSFSGSCGAFTCEGDAVQCAVAQEQHKRNCKLFDEKTALSDLGNSLAVGTDPNAADSPFAEANKSKFNFGGADGRIDQSTLWGGQCIPPQSFSVFGQSFTIDTTELCETIALFGNLFVAVSLLGAVRIIGTGA